MHSAHHCPLKPHEAKDFLQVFCTSASSEGIFLFTLFFTIIHHQEKQHILGNHEEAKKMNFSTKMHKEQNPFVFPLLLNFPQKKTTHKQNRHTCIQILLSFPRNSRLLIASPDNYISSLLRQIMAQIVTQNSGSTGRKMCNLPLQAASGAIATMDFLASPSTMGDLLIWPWRDAHFFTNPIFTNPITWALCWTWGFLYFFLTAD